MTIGAESSAAKGPRQSGPAPRRAPDWGGPGAEGGEAKRDRQPLVRTAAAPAAHCADKQLQIRPLLRKVVQPIRRCLSR